MSVVSVSFHPHVIHDVCLSVRWLSFVFLSHLFLSVVYLFSSTRYLISARHSFFHVDNAAMATYNPLTNTACHTVTSHDTTSHDMTWQHMITHEHIHEHEQTQKTQPQTQKHTHITDISQIMYIETKSCYRLTIPAPRPTPASPASQPASQRFLTCGKYVFPPSAVRNVIIF